MKFVTGTIILGSSIGLVAADHEGTNLPFDQWPARDFKDANSGFYTTEETHALLSNANEDRLTTCGKLKTIYTDNVCCSNPTKEVDIDRGYLYGTVHDGEFGIPATDTPWDDARRRLRADRRRQLGFLGDAWDTFKGAASTGAKWAMGKAGDYVKENGADLAKKYITLDNAKKVGGKALDMWNGNGGSQTGSPADTGAAYAYEGGDNFGYDWNNADDDWRRRRLTGGDDPATIAAGWTERADVPIAVGGGETVTAVEYWTHFCDGDLYPKDGFLDPSVCLINRKLVTAWTQCWFDVNLGYHKDYWGDPDVLNALCDGADAHPQLDYGDGGAHSSIGNLTTHLGSSMYEDLFANLVGGNAFSDFKRLLDGVTRLPDLDDPKAVLDYGVGLLTSSEKDAKSFSVANLVTSFKGIVDKIQGKSGSTFDWLSMLNNL